jgi:acyl-CoA synthetase (AMP-forming)/AMP-acid ligase II
MPEAEQDDVLRSIGIPLDTVIMTSVPTADADASVSSAASQESEHEEVFEVVLSGTQLARASCDDHGVLRTGDYGVERPSGTLVLRGRKDNQIKRSGRRVNLEEIDAAVVRGCGGLVSGATAFCPVTSNHSVVESAVVMTPLLPPGETCLRPQSLSTVTRR